MMAPSLEFTNVIAVSTEPSIDRRDEQSASFGKEVTPGVSIAGNVFCAVAIWLGGAGAAVQAVKSSAIPHKRKRVVNRLKNL